MADAADLHEIRLVTSLSNVDREQWNAVSNPPGERYDPFLDWEFLEALESTGCATPETGWYSHHIIAYDSHNTIIGALPGYLKTHSQGEFVFDHSWADAYERAGGDYYPKFLIAVPFTPVTGRRRLVPNGPHADAICDALTQAAVQIVSERKYSSMHLNFIDRMEWEKLGAMGLLQRQDQQFHWVNNNYASFEDFLLELTSRKRKDLRKEREKANEGIRFEHLSGKALTTEHWDYFYTFYQDTGARKWGSPYLNREFFSVLNDRMSEKVLLVLAIDETRGIPIAGALNMIGSDTLYGRYWGCTDPRPMLHFESCYYQAIDYAIAHGLRYVEAGAQGGHKLARGYAPTPTYSAHFILNEGFSDAVAKYLEHEREQVESDIEYLGQRTPFKKRDEQL